MTAATTSLNERRARIITAITKKKQEDPEHLLVVQDGVAGEADRDAMIRVELVLGGDPADLGRRAGGGEDRVEVEDRIDHQHPALHCFDRRAAQQDLLPGDLEGELRIGLDRRVAYAIEQDREIPERGIAALGLLEPPLDQRGEVGDGGLALQCRQDRLDLGDLQAELVEIVELAVEQAMFLEEFARSGDVDVVEEVRPLGEGLLQTLGCLTRDLGRLAVDHDEHHVLDIREAVGELEVVLARLEIRRDQVHVVGVDAEVEGGVDAERQGEQPRHREHGAGVRVHATYPEHEGVAQGRFDSIHLVVRPRPESSGWRLRARSPVAEYRGREVRFRPAWKHVSPPDSPTEPSLRRPSTDRSPRGVG
jgi:hypothetical protein